jgi:serine protease Do
MIMKNLIVFLLMFVPVLLNAQIEDLVAKVEESIVTVYTYDSFGNALGSGTGFFLEDGTLISNYHVIDGADYAFIKLNDGSKVEILEVISSNSEKDLVKLKVDGYFSDKGLITNFELPNRGESVLIIGSPFGFEQTISEGIVSSVRVNDEMSTKVIQTTASISPGSSGSPVMNMKGEVVGVATYQFKKGQSLNFAVPINQIQYLENESSLSIGKVSIKDKVIINEKCKFNSELTLNSIEYLNNRTLVHFTFTNVSIGYGESMIIYSNIEDPKTRFYIKDDNSNRKYYAVKSGIGNSRENPTIVPLGAAISFTFEFEELPRSATQISILEGIGSSWKFLNLNLSDYLNIDRTNVESYNDQVALTKMKNKDIDGAMRLLSSSDEENGKVAASSYNIMGIIAYKRDNNFNSISYFTKAIDSDPTNDIFYFNRAAVYRDKKQDYAAAIEDITNAISINPSQADYYYHRGALYMAIEDYKNARNDLQLASNMMGENSTILSSLGSCKLILTQGAEGCSDLKRAYEIAENQEAQDQIRYVIDNYCK